HWVGVRAQLTRLSLLSLIILLWALPLYLYGLDMARHLVFPCAYLIYCIPLSFLDHLTFPLRLIASAIAAFLLNGLGIETVRKGTAIYTMAAGGFNMEVADPCSGLRSLLAMTALTAVYAYFTQRTSIRKVALFLTAVPVAIVGNVVRIVSTGLVAQGFGRDAALRLYHDFSGYVVFGVSVLLITAAGRLIQRITIGKRSG
ncbi:MAG: exosortase/archaeosortase family protein, partial [Kiritimatiellae bacterium]|nr:exosortase/archaeosortase family protein [Kiritimatiellia bacterium]